MYFPGLHIVCRQIKIRVLVCLLHRRVAKLVAEQQIESPEAAAAVLALVRQTGRLGPDLYPLKVRVLAHVLFVRLHKAEAAPALGAGEAAPPLPMDPLVVPQFLPVLQDLTATGAGVALTGGVSQHVGSQPAHVPEQPPAAWA